MSLATEQIKEVIVAPFAVEADHPRNCDLIVQCIPGCRLRSAIDGSKPAINNNTGEPIVPVDQSRHLASFPKTPGMRLFVNPAELKYEIIDPITDDEALLTRVTKWMKEHSLHNGVSIIKGNPPLKGTLDVHAMKSLCQELYNMLNAKEVKMHKGAALDIDDIEQLPGHFLLNPGIRTGTTQPRYAHEFPAWVENLSHSGG